MREWHGMGGTTVLSKQEWDDPKAWSEDTNLLRRLPTKYSSSRTLTPCYQTKTADCQLSILFLFYQWSKSTHRPEVASLVCWYEGSSWTFLSAMIHTSVVKVRCRIDTLFKRFSGLESRYLAQSWSTNWSCGVLHPASCWKLPNQWYCRTSRYGPGIEFIPTISNISLHMVHRTNECLIEDNADTIHTWYFSHSHPKNETKRLIGLPPSNGGPLAFSIFHFWR